ncbi:MAG: hypothetical protein WA765_12110 [Candidatus Acidiferrum sp.]
MLKRLVKSLLILIIFVPFATFLPLAAVAMMRSPEGAEFWFWVAPWSCCFWVLIYSTLSACPWRQGGEAVRQWREAHGGLLVTSVRATAWMFFGLLASYAAEFLLLFLRRGAASGRACLPLFTYSPLVLAWGWRRIHG